MSKNILSVIVVTLLLRMFNNQSPGGTEPAPEPHQPPTPEPEPEPEPEVDNRVITSGIKGLKLGRRLGFVNKIHITNSSKFYKFKVRYKSHALLDGLKIKWCEADFNTDYEWSEIIVYPSDTHTIRADTWRCDIHVFRVDKAETLIAKSLSNSSRDIRIIDRSAVMAKSPRRGCF